MPLDTPVRALSGGYKRRLALAIQLVRDPHVLCLDEPLAGLDWKARAEARVVHALELFVCLRSTLKRLRESSWCRVVSCGRSDIVYLNTTYLKPISLKSFNCLKADAFQAHGLKNKFNFHRPKRGASLDVHARFMRSVGH